MIQIANKRGPDIGVNPCQPSERHVSEHLCCCAHPGGTLVDSSVALGRCAFMVFCCISHLTTCFDLCEVR